MADAQIFQQAPGRSGSTRATILLSFGLVANLAALMTFAATLNESPPTGRSTRASRGGSAAFTSPDTRPLSRS